MSGSLVERSLQAVEVLAERPDGLGVAECAEALGIPKTGAHRLLTELTRLGWVRSLSTGRYVLTTRLLTVAFRHLSEAGIVDPAQPLLDRLAAQSEELVRLAVTDGDRLVWVAKAQGARSGLRYDPQQGGSPHLASMATGHAWLATMSDAAALRLVLAEGITADGTGPNAPTSVAAIQRSIRNARTRGYAVVIDSSASAVAAIAVAIRQPGTNSVLGVLSIGGPSARLTRKRLDGLAGDLRSTADELGAICAGSPMLRGLSV